MRNITLWILFIAAIGSLFPIYPLAELSVEDELVVTMKTPQGETKVYTSHEEIQFKGVKRGLPLGNREWQQTLCNEDTLEEYANFTETQLELDTMIREINKSRKPRKLSEHQKDFLSAIPPCDAYITKLRVIVRLLKGYDLIDMSPNTVFTEDDSIYFHDF